MAELERTKKSKTSTAAGAKEPSARVRVFDYFDYRAFLKAYFDAKKALNPSFSHRVFAKQADLGSPSYLLMIMKRERNLSMKTLKKFSDALRLEGRERAYFELLVQYDQTEQLEEKSCLFSELLRLRVKSDALYELENDRFEFLSKWYVVATYVLVGMKGFRPDPKWLVSALRKKASLAQTTEALEILQRLQLVTIENGRWSQTDGALTVADDTKTMAVARYHDAMMKLAYEALKNLPLSKREMNGVTLSVPAHKMTELKEKIRAFRKEINAWSSGFQDADQVLQLNIQLFPLSEVIEESEA